MSSLTIRPRGRFLPRASISRQAALHELLREAYRLLPDVAEMELVDSMAGLRPGTPDNLPLIGPGAVDGPVGGPVGGDDQLEAAARRRGNPLDEHPDAVDIEYEREGKRYLFIDTAGIRARSKHSSSVEVFSVMRAEKTITRADICVLVIDAAEGIKAQDRRIAALIQNARKACMIVLNKWDLVRTNRKQRQTMEAAIANARAELFFIDYAPVLVTSALTGEYADRIFKMIERIRRAARAHIGTGKLNRALRAAFAANPPPMVKGKRLKLFYATQSSGNESREFAPPEIVLFVNSPRLLTQPFARFLEAKIRELEPYPGSPILLTCRARLDRHSERNREIPSRKR